jgi:hypothetical protein
MGRMLSTRSNYNLDTGQITATRSKTDEETPNMKMVSARERSNAVQVYPFEDEGLLQAVCEAAAMGDDDFGDPHRSMLMHLGRRVIASGPGVYVCMCVCIYI